MHKQRSSSLILFCQIKVNAQILRSQKTSHHDRLEQDVLKKVTAGFGLILKNERTTLASSNAFKRLIDKLNNTGVR